jgi:amino acid transporter
MKPSMLKGIGIGCFVLGAFLIFFAFERYQANANNVEQVKTIMGNFPMGDMLGVRNVNPGMPTVSKYALFFGVLAIAGGVACFVTAPKLAATAKPSPPFGE